VDTKGDLGLAVQVRFSKEEGEGRVLGGGLELRCTEKVPRRVKIRRGSVIRKGVWEGPVAKFLVFWPG
jgi:hypothetical protein